MTWYLFQTRVATIGDVDQRLAYINAALRVWETVLDMRLKAVADQTYISVRRLNRTVDERGLRSGANLKTLIKHVLVDTCHSSCAALNREFEDETRYLRALRDFYEGECLPVGPVH